MLKWAWGWFEVVLRTAIVNARAKSTPNRSGLGGGKRKKIRLRNRYQGPHFEAKFLKKGFVFVGARLVEWYIYNPLSRDEPFDWIFDYIATNMGIKA